MLTLYGRGTRGERAALLYVAFFRQPYGIDDNAPYVLVRYTCTAAHCTPCSRTCTCSPSAWLRGAPHPHPGACVAA